MKKILFQGDSITDAGRDRDKVYSWGRSYPFLIEAELGYDRPAEYEFINRGISGNRIVDLYARMKEDILNLKPDYISFLIGVNDVWHEIGRGCGVDADKYEKIYSMLIEEIKEALPDAKIMILEPFCLRASATDSTAEEPDKWNVFRTEVCKRAEKAKNVAQRFGVTFVALQEMFDKASETTADTVGNSYWLWDGVHPTPKGHELIRREWMKAFKKIAD